MAHQPSAIVIGAGPAGLAAAIALSERGFAVSVHERRADADVVGTGLTLWPNGLAALATFGAEAAVARRALAAPGTQMRTDRGRVLSEMPAAALDAAGGRGVAIARGDLLAALAGRLDPGVIRWGRRCVGVSGTPDGATAAFADGADARADLVIGADGMRSPVRTSCGIRARLRYAGFTVWRGTVRFPMASRPGLLTLGGPYQFGLWQLPDDEVYWFAAAPTSETTGRRGRTRPPAVFDDWHEPIPQLIAATSTERITVTAIYDCRPLPRWSSGRIVLVGDAAHPSLPNMGQGTSQAFEDVAVLADRLAAEPRIEQALRQYEARRRARARAAWSQARMLARMGAWRGGLACRVRETLMTAVPQRAQRAQLARLFAFPGAHAETRRSTQEAHDERG
ncbi:FAD-dependent monooxygenase [Mangrovihabitans endophyticus]|uniref:Salicylate hydroxylase n=1 Tax=Mangrovihabitans endophyticus TaxID=1751298 RepID=A0A8J3BTB8_9ACTN|nr:FAD-dependent monooxygenase [Mangrovihabitans endophyticus]GGK76516.1 salicylate hydroxylase [Mangrovihabitans endophyticus]